MLGLRFILRGYFEYMKGKNEYLHTFILLMQDSYSVMNGYVQLVFNDVHLVWCRKFKIYTLMWMWFYVLI